MLNPSDYTVGWICALVKELVAAEAFLDKKHDPLDYIPDHDNNSYTLGEVGKHNVVITVMPQGQYGTVNAAVVARDMARTFPNVRIGLMVGIGGGAPSKENDVRLGDIVVGAPGHANGGVVQYDYGKTIQGKYFEATGYLNQPPLFMLTAIATLKAQYESDGHNIDATIEEVLRKKRRLKPKYSHPPYTTDKLYDSHWVHQGSSKDHCNELCRNAKLKLRHERSVDEDNPAIHYGLIASGNQLVKDAWLRDWLVAEKNVLCFEMEAAGLMNHFPCVIIRGICDYADTHKNDSWQGYAAMTAAAYAKDLLNKIAPNKIKAEKPIHDVLLAEGQSPNN
ncbi:purine and uridine phosphorylase [Xylaria cubensis]|nr:purine and uridine phosphorylase [Xylaria cubensis]